MRQPVRLGGLHAAARVLFGAGFFVMVSSAAAQAQTNTFISNLPHLFDERVAQVAGSTATLAQMFSTGDVGWGGGGLRVEPQLDLLYAQEALDGFIDSLGHDAPSEQLRRVRLGFGPKVTWELDESTTFGTLRVNLESHNLESAEDRSKDISASLELGHRWEIDGARVLDLSAHVDGLGMGWFTSLSLGLRYVMEF